MGTLPRASVFVVVPAYQEAGAIGSVVAALRAEDWPVVVVDDGSADDTAAIARAAGAHVLRHVVNLGQGAALQTGIDWAVRRGAGQIVTFDADGQHSVSDIPALLAALDGGADVALGSRFLGTTVGASLGRRAFLRMAVWSSNRMSGVSLTDAHCGLRALDARIAPAIRLHQPRMAHASELLLNIRRAGLRVVEVPVTIRYTAYSQAKGQGAIQAIRIVWDHFFRRAGRPPTRAK